ncbi:MAG: chromosome segregation protein SMC [Opitutales bacterium]
MHLKQVVINGFKSFADRTRLELHPGVVAIVGPNGCGKSNIADAIRWVLGEQSAKAMRGAKMQDVIFAGSDKRKALNLSEVTLTFTDCEEQLGTPYHEVEIGRRVTREGSSDYFINGKACRLKDIQRLFMDTGVGRVSYSFLVQGQIDQILSSNPAERRVIFEEAAGITKYKAQRRETLNKLALVDANLARVTDVIEEVSRQIGSLKRQASKALRYKRINHRLTHLDLALQAWRYGNLRAEVTDLEQKDQAYRRELEGVRGILEAEEAALQGRREERSTRYNAMQEAQKTVYNLRSEKENAENKAGFASVRREDIRERIGNIEQEIERYGAQRDELKNQARSNTETKQLQLGLVGDSDQVFRDKNREVLEAQEHLQEAEETLEARRQELMDLENAMTRLRSGTTTLEVDMKSYQVKHAGLADTLASLKDRRETLEAELAELESALRRRQQDREQAESAREQAREAQAKARESFRSLQGDIQELDRQLARKTAHLQVLERMNASFEGFGEGARAVLQGKAGDAVDAAQCKPLMQHVKVDAAWTTALEALLDSARDAIAVPERETALALVKTLQEKRLGRASLVVPGEAPEGSRYDAAPAESGLTSARRQVLARDESLAGALATLLDGCWFAPDLATVEAFLRKKPDFRFYRIGLADGTVIDRRGLFFGGRGKGENPSVLARQNEIRSLTEAIKRETAELNNQRAAAEQAQTALDEAEADLEEQRNRLVELGKEITTLESQISSNRRSLEANDNEQVETRAALESMEAQHKESLQKLEKAQQDLAAAQKKLDAQREAIRSAESQVAARREERDNRREALSDVRLQLAEKRQKLENLDRSLASLQQNITEVENLLQRRHQELDTLHEQIGELDAEEAEHQRTAAELEKTLQTTMASLDKDREAFQALEKEVKAAEEGMSGHREKERDLESNLTRVEVKLAESRSRLEFLLERVTGDYQTEIAEVDWKHSLWEADREFEKRIDLDALEEGEPLEVQPKEEAREPEPEEVEAYANPDWKAVEEEVRELKNRVQAMGPVNLVAIEEYADLSQRYKFLKEQSEDLWNAKNELLQAIDEINNTSQELFATTFEQITKNFKYTYDQLTGGGFADLALVDADDVLESGIEITARPPGTKLRSISLLSGGQKTMTAVALLFAIYMVKPSPFCVLDELDAPLDDANIGRFTEMLKSFTRFSQFLIITHNKRTIAASDLIFGVTMPEKGVSRLVSMRFDKGAGQAKSVETGETVPVG